MKLANVRRIAKEEMPEAPAWIDKLLTPLNQSIEQLTQAVSGQLTYGDNSLSSVITNTFVHGVELITKNPLPSGSRPLGVHPFTTDNVVGIDGYRLTYKPSGDVGITIWFKSPYADVYLARAADQVIPNNANTPVDWTVSRRLSGSLSWSATTNPSRVTATAPGLYLFTYDGVYASNNTGSRAFFLVKNGIAAAADKAFGSQFLLNNGAHTFMTSGSAIISLNANDYVELITFQDSGGNLNVPGNAFAEVKLMAHTLDVQTGYSSPVNYVLVGGG